jgi:hypothetical protein
MKNLTLAFALLIALNPIAGCSAAEGVFLLSPESGPKLMTQCSRSAPHNVTSFWKPTIEQVNSVEAGLPGFLESMKARPVSEFNRQYIGFSKNGKRYIYGNFYIRESGAQHGGTIPVIACDGGDYFWGVVFDIKSKEFSDFSTNGAFDPPAK